MTKMIEIKKMTKIRVLVFLSFLLILLIFLISKVFSGAIILPQYFFLGPLKIHYYGIIMALATASGFYLALRRAAQYGISEKRAEDILFWLIIAGFIGARLYHVFSDVGYYYIHPVDVFKIYNGGLSIYGALIGGLLVVILYAKRFTLRALHLLDWLTPSLVLGQIIGRFGNLFNYEAFGYPTNLPWKMFVPYQFRPGQYLQYNFFHPFFLYEALGNLIILFILFKLVESSDKPIFDTASNLVLFRRASSDKSQGTLFFSYLLLYNVLRFCLEFFRTDSTFIHGFRLNAVVSLGLVLLAIIALSIIHSPKTSNP